MADERSPEARIARVESLFARLEERINAVVENRRDWKLEVERRLDENNRNASKLMEERAKDRAELATKGELESYVRELTSRMNEHERDDVRKHESEEARVKSLEEYKATLNDAPLQLRALSDFKSNIQGRMIAMAFIAVLLATVVQIVIHALGH